jgi:hypothetical protein
MDYQEKINEEVLCILKFATTNSKLLEVGYVNLEGEDLEKKFALFFEKYQSLIYSSEEVCNKATEEFLLKEEAILLKAYRSHCRNVGNAYTQLDELDMKMYIEAENLKENNYKNALEDPRGKNIEEIEKNREDAKIELRKYLLSDLKHHLLAYRLSETYQKMKQEINNKNIVAYSHREIGWREFSFKASEIFKFKFSTNFGYGSSSYFFLAMTYKDIEIIPYSHWVIYRFAGYKEVFRYSQKYRLRNSEWFDAMKYTQEAYNLSVTNPAQFISIYIIKQCEIMVDGLEKYLTEDIFTLYNERGEYDYKSKKYPEIRLEIKENKRSLLEFRAEKIAGALRFIHSIASFKDIEKMPSFIVRIEKCNNELLPKLQKELEILSHELPVQEQQLAELKAKYEETQSLLTDYKLRAEVVNYTIELEKLETPSYNIDLKLREEFPEIKRIHEVKEYWAKEITNSDIQLSSLKQFQKEYANYSSQIIVYFENKQKLLSAA